MFLTNLEETREERELLLLYKTLKAQHEKIDGKSFFFLHFFLHVEVLFLEVLTKRGCRHNSDCSLDVLVVVVLVVVVVVELPSKALAMWLMAVSMTKPCTHAKTLRQ